MPNNKKNIKYNVLSILRGTTVDGPGFRTSIYLSGCRHNCEECHNPQSWDENNGESMGLDDILAIVEEEDFDVTITGGDPLFYPEKLRILIKELKDNKRNVWVYTGYTWEEIIGTHTLLRSIEKADVLVDGRYIKELRDIDIPFRGSSNQRLINIQESIVRKKIIPAKTGII